MSSFRVRYQTIEFGNVDIHVRTLRDLQQHGDADGIAADAGISSAAWSLFGVIWPAGRVLAHTMADYAIDGKRILEVGCGIGLASLVLNQRHADVTATDYHPEAEQFLNINVALNNGRPIPFLLATWTQILNSLGQFDLIIGSDVLYEQFHLEALAGFIERHAKPHCDVLIVDPGRGNHGLFNRHMVGHGFVHSQQQASAMPLDSLDVPFRGKVLSYRRTPAADLQDNQA